MKYCIWHRHVNRVAVNLSGQRLENMSEQEAKYIYGLIHPDVRVMVEIRPMRHLHVVN